MADIIAFPERCADTERRALIVKARADYDSVFPAQTTTSVLPDTAQERNRLRLNSIHRHDNFKFRTGDKPTIDHADDLLMDHADNGVPSDSAFHAPDTDPA